MNITKKLLVVAVAGLLFASCKETPKSDVEGTPTTTVDTTNTTAAVTKVAPENLQTASFTIDGMSCAVMCAAKIEKELASQEGVQSAKVDFDSKKATIEYDATKQSPEKLAKTAEAVAGGKLYKVSDIKSSSDQASLLDQEKPAKNAKAKTEKAKTTTTTEEKDKSCHESGTGKKACCAEKKTTTT